MDERDPAAVQQPSADWQKLVIQPSGAKQPTRSEDTPDWFLAGLVASANSGVGGLGVTLSVGGLLISGSIIGAPDYFIAVGEEAASVLNSDEAASVRKVFASLAEKSRQKIGDKKRKPPMFVHLKDARMFHPGGQPVPGNRSVVWRGRLSAVDGFNFGTLSAPPK